MSRFAILVLAVQACLLQTVYSQCLGSYGYGAAPFGLAGPYGYGAEVAAPLGYGIGPYAAGPAYGGVGVGEVAIAGELGVSGITAVAGQVPIIGSVEFGGIVPAAGAVTITGSCACGRAGPYVY